jgi:hypothetical protein
MVGRRFLRWVAATIALAAAVQIGSLQAAQADASGHSTQASCMGFEASSISPPGSSEEEPGGTPQFVAEVKEIAAELGVRPGVIVAFIASLHGGSHEACDELLG